MLELDELEHKLGIPAPTFQNVVVSLPKRVEAGFEVRCSTITYVRPAFILARSMYHQHILCIVSYNFLKPLKSYLEAVLWCLTF